VWRAFFGHKRHKRHRKDGGCPREMEEIPEKLLKGAKVTGGKVPKGAPVVREIEVRGQKG